MEEKQVLISQIRIFLIFKEGISMIKAILFDMDGTVIDSIKSDFEAFRKAFEQFHYNLSYQAYIEKTGARGEEIVAAIAPELSAGEIEKLLRQKEENFKTLARQNKPEAVKGIELILRRAKEIPLWTALATGAKRKKVDFILNRVEIAQYFDVILTADDVSIGKPAPDIFLAAAHKLHVQPSECIVFEDAEMGIEAAKRAKMHCIAIVNSTPKEMLQKADLVIENYADLHLEEYIETINRAAINKH